MQKNVILATILSLLVIFVWSRFFLPSFNPPPSPVKTSPVSEKDSTVSLPQEVKAKTEKVEKEIPLDLGKKSIVFTTAGAGIKHWILHEENETIDLVLSQAENNIFLATLPELNYELVSREGGKIVFRAITSENIAVRKTYEFGDDAYFGYLNLEISNLKSEEKKLPLTLLNLGPGLGTDEKGLKENIRHLRALGYQNKKTVEKLKFNTYGGNWAWFGVDNRYFLAALFPETKIDELVVEKVNPQKIPLIKINSNLSLSGKEIIDSSKASFRFRFYLGPKKYDDLKKYGLGLEKTVNFGLFAEISKVAFYSMKWLYKLTGNYGLAIIILTLVLQIILFPLTKKSFEASLSMKKMQPLLDELKLKHKDDPKRFQAELFNLYRTKKANPFKGCLPMLLQIPIFWALFTTLQNAYELRGAEFMLWIRDLSHPDTLFRIGSIPINILPLLMGGLMLFQQKLTAVTTDPTQKQMMYLMPIMFTFLFWNFPSGLVLYWLTSSLFSSLGQLYLLKKSK